MLSYDEINEFYRLFQIVEQQMVQMKIKRLIKFNYIDNVTRYLFDERLRKQTLKKYDTIFEVLFFYIISFSIFFVILLMIIIHAIDSLIYHLYVAILQ